MCRNQVQPKVNGRITLVSDVTWGGAALACRRLLLGLTNAGADVSWLAAVGDMMSDARVGSEWPHLTSWLLNRLAKQFRMPNSVTRRTEGSLHERTMRQMIDSDKPAVINLHNIHHLLNTSFLRHLSPQIPVVWTLHDMWLLTGGCVYSFECDSYLDGCADRGTHCPVEREERVRAWEQKEMFLERNAGNLVLVSPSQWSASCAERRCQGRVRVEHIPNSVDLDVFKPVNPVQSARGVLGISDKVSLILTGSDVLEDSRKGGKYLRESIRCVQNSGREVQVLAFGVPPPLSRRETGWTYTGAIRDEKLLNLYYNAADVYVLPTLSDNLPNTLLEAIAAGTPCIASDVGGCSEVVREGVTGVLAAPADVAALSRAITGFLDLPKPERSDMARKCRQVAEEEYGLPTQAGRYLELFEELTDGGQRRKTCQTGGMVRAQGG